MPTKSVSKLLQLCEIILKQVPKNLNAPRDAVWKIKSTLQQSWCIQNFVMQNFQDYDIIQIHNYTSHLLKLLTMWLCWWDILDRFSNGVCIWHCWCICNFLCLFEIGVVILIIISSSTKNFLLHLKIYVFPLSLFQACILCYLNCLSCLKQDLVVLCQPSPFVNGSIIVNNVRANPKNHINIYLWMQSILNTICGRDDVKNKVMTMCYWWDEEWWSVGEVPVPCGSGDKV